MDTEIEDTTIIECEEHSELLTFDGFVLICVSCVMEDYNNV